MKILEKRMLSESLLYLCLDAKERSDLFTKAGQYVVVEINGKSLYLVIGSSIGDQVWGFYIRICNEVTESLLKLNCDQSLKVSEPQGNGYPMEKLVKQDVLLLSAGTGLAAFKSVLSQIMKNRESYQRIILIHGSRSYEELPYSEEINLWSQSDIEVYVTLSKPADDWAYYEGYVQNVLDAQQLDLNTFRCLICGPKQMVADATEKAMALGVKKEHFYSNY